MGVSVCLKRYRNIPLTDCIPIGFFIFLFLVFDLDLTGNQGILGVPDGSGRSSDDT